MADKAIYSVDTVTSMSGTDKVYVNTGNNIKQITKDNLCGNAISDLSTDMKRIFKHKNLIGNTLDYYPVFIKGGSTITCSTYDGSVSSITEAVIKFYDKNKTIVEDRSSILSGNRSRTFTLNSNDVYYVKWETLPTIPIQMELGDCATSYEEYIDDYNFNAIVDVNSSMSDYGLNNVFDGELVNGYHDWSNGNFVDNTTVVEIKNAISVNNGDTVSVKTEQVFKYICCVFFNNETYVSGNYVENKNECAFMIPSGVNRVYVYFSKGATITPSTAGHIGIYINNQIDVVENGKEDKYTLELNYSTKCVHFENVVNTDEYFEAMVFDRSDKKKYIKVSGYRPSENDEENEISYINLGSKTLNIVRSNNQVIMFSGGSEVYDAYIKAIR